MKKTYILLSAALMFFGLTAKAQTTITFDTEDYAGISVYDKWEESPFRTGELEGNAGVASNPSTTPDEVLGVAPNTTEKVVAFQRSRYGSNVYGVRIDLKEPIRVTKELQYVHVMTYLKDKPAASRMMVIGLGRRLEASWSGQAGQDVEQFWSYTPANVQPKDGWQDIVVSFKGFSYSKEENANSGIDLHALVIVPDVRTPDEDAADWVAYFDEIVVDDNPDKRFSTEQYALTHDKEAAMNRTDRGLNKVGLTVGEKTYESAARSKKLYSDNTTTSVFSAKAGDQVQPTFGYSGNWMSGYVYVDWGNDALFKDALNADGTPAEGSDVVSYNALQIGETWYKSDGTTRGDGNGIGQGVPTFTVPAGTTPGFYRMRYKVDWNSINPAGATDIITNGGGIVDLMLDVHGDEVTVNASQLNGDIRTANGDNLISYPAGYEQPFEVKIAPAPGFVQYGFKLKYGYNVTAKDQLDDKGNPNWIEVNVPYTEIAGDGTYTIPAEYMRGSQVSITGDMQQEQLYTVEVVGLEGQGGVVYANIETLHGGTVYATQFFTVEQVEAIAVEGYTSIVTLNDRVITVTYRSAAVAYREVTSLTELKNYKLYQIKSNNNEGYLAWNHSITDQYLSLRGVTNFQSGEPSAEVRAQYAEEVSPFDETVVWRIFKEGDKYYLYHPAKNAYVTRSGRDYQFTDTKTALDAIHVNDDGSFAFHAGGGYSDGSTNFACIVTNENQIAVRNWTATDHGAKMQIIENPNVYTLEYTVEVVGGVADGGITLDGTDYAHGATVVSTQFLTAADVTAKEVFMSEANVTVNVENRTIRVAYTTTPSEVVTSITSGKLYTLECRSGNAHSSARFIGITADGKISGQSSTPALIKFEEANEENGYYIKIVDAGKYLNHNGSNISASAERNTMWTLGVPTHTANVVTFTIGNDKYLNNNGSDCNDNTCTNLKANSHGGGPGSDNACSLWEMKEYPEPEKVLAFVEPVEGKYYKIMGDNQAGMPWLTNQLNGNSIVVSANEADAAIFEKTANGLKDVVTGKYLGMNGSVVSLVDNETNVVIGEHNDDNATGNGVKYSIKVSTNYMYNNNNDGKTHESYDWITTIERYWGFIEVAYEPEEEEPDPSTMVYSPTTTNLTSGELNQMTKPTLIAIKNLSSTNNYYFVGNTGATPYSKADFSNEAVFVWTPVEEGVAGSYYLKKFDGTYMQKISPKDFGTVENAAVFSTTNPTSQGSGSTYFNGDGDSQNYINGNDDANLVRFVTDGKWINVQNVSSGTPTYNTGTGGWTIHYVYTVEGRKIEDEPELPEHTDAAKGLNIYFNPCGVVGTNYLTLAEVKGEGAIDPITYKTTSKPASWHVPYPHDYGQVVRGGTFNVNITLSATPASDLVATAYFDWDANGEFETTEAITLNGTAGTASVSVPTDAAASHMRMRVRINSNGLDRAEDDVEGFAYDFHLTTVDAQQNLTVRASSSSASRGTVTLSSNAESYARGTELTATATPKNNATFTCWKEEGVVVSTEATYTFTVDHNVNLKAYFTPAFSYDDRLDYYIGEAEAIESGDLVGQYSAAAVTALADDIAAAKNVAEATQNDVATLQAAMNSLAVNMPSPAKYYKIVNPSAANQVAYADNTNSCSWGDNTTPAGVWVFEEGTADNKFYLRNLSTGSYTTSYNKDATVVLGEKDQEVTVVYHGANRQMGIAPNGGQQLNRANGRLCAWTDNPGLNSNSAWIIEEVAPEEITHSLTVTAAMWASLMLGFDAEIPEGLTAYVGTLVDDCLTLNEVSGILPAETPVLIKAEAADYDFNYSANTPAVIDNNNLQGTLFSKPVSSVTEGTVYTLQWYTPQGEDDTYTLPVVFKQYANEDNTTDGLTLGANKAYLVLDSGSASAISIRFEGSTDVEFSTLNSQPSTEVYDLMGRRVQNPAKGVYIVKGKKIVSNDN